MHTLIVKLAVSPLLTFEKFVFCFIGALVDFYTFLSRIIFYLEKNNLEFWNKMASLFIAHFKDSA